MVVKLLVGVYTGTRTKLQYNLENDTFEPDELIGDDWDDIRSSI